MPTVLQAQAPQMEEVRLSFLRTDSRYQRPLSPVLVRRISTSFNSAKMGLIIVSKRDDGFYYILDGQHRVAALRALNHTDAPCYVYTDLTPKQEADIFETMNRVRRRATTRDSFRARYFMGDPTVIGIQTIANESGILLGKSASNTTQHASTTAAYKTLEDIYTTDVANGFGPAALRETLKVIRESWPDEGEALKGPFIIGVAVFLAAFGNRTNHAEIVRKFSRVSAIRVNQDAYVYVHSLTDNTHAAGRGVAMALVDVYNLNRPLNNDSRFNSGEITEKSRLLQTSGRRPHTA
jgi:ParB-like nuclease domain